MTWQFCCSQTEMVALVQLFCNVDHFEFGQNKILTSSLNITVLLISVPGEGDIG